MMDLIETRLGPLRGKVQQLAADLRRADRSRSDKAVLLAQRVLWTLRLSKRVLVGRIAFFELRTPPRVLRGMRDLLVRPGHREDIAALSAVDGAPQDVLRQRFDRGDLCFVGQLDGRILCHAWFHRGPDPFPEDGSGYAAWELGPSDYWSYDAAANAESRLSGVFVKVFQTALLSLFRDHGAERIQCSVRLANDASRLLHERLGFRRLGVMTAISLPGIKWLHFDGPAVQRQWLVPLGAAIDLPVPPVPPPSSMGIA